MMPDDRLTDLVDRWQLLFQEGRDVPAAALCADCPDLAPELERRVEAMRRMNRLVMPAAGAAERGGPGGGPAAPPGPTAASPKPVGPTRRALSAGPADRNLLFGILALQMDFVGRDALVAAMNA
jgi:hypothetical protein